MQSESTVDKATKRARWLKRAKILGGVLLVWMVLETSIDLNPPLDRFDDPSVSEEEATRKTKAGDWAALLPVLIRGIRNGDKAAHVMLGNYYRDARPPFHVDYCSAFDEYVKAGVLGDTEAQLQVAEMLMIGQGGYKSIIEAYMWALYAKQHGNKLAEVDVDVLSSTLSADFRAELARKSADWKPSSIDFPKTYRIPIIPIVGRVISLIVPIRYCGDPTVLQHLLRWAGYR